MKEFSYKFVKSGSQYIVHTYYGDTMEGVYEYTNLKDALKFVSLLRHAGIHKRTGLLHD